jgi:hypothetical protein
MSTALESGLLNILVNSGIFEDKPKSSRCQIQRRGKESAAERSVSLKGGADLGTRETAAPLRDPVRASPPPLSAPTKRVPLGESVRIESDNSRDEPNAFLFFFFFFL